jgi:hypothetical protein
MLIGGLYVNSFWLTKKPRFYPRLHEKVGYMLIVFSQKFLLDNHQYRLQIMHPNRPGLSVLILH